MRRLMGVVVLPLAVALGACGSDAVTSPLQQQQSMVGTWSLLSVDGLALPFILAQVGSDDFAIVGDVIAADSGGTFTERTIIQSTVNGQVAADTIADGGEYVLSGTSVALTFASTGSTTVGSIGGDLLSLADGSGGWLYQRQ